VRPNAEVIVIEKNKTYLNNWFDRSKTSATSTIIKQKNKDTRDLEKIFDQSAQLKDDKENNAWYEAATNMKDISHEPM
jgi:hypothetical protein